MNSSSGGVGGTFRRLRNILSGRQTLFLMIRLLKFPYELLKPLYRKSSVHRSVIDEVENRDLKRAYAFCREITRRHAKTFYLAIRFLPNEKQRSIFALYSLCRQLDDLVDEAESRENRGHTVYSVRKTLENWKRRLVRIDRISKGDHHILLAFSDVMRRFKIPLELPLQLLTGVGTDLQKKRYENFGELYEYSYRVASVVGLMCCEIFGYRTPEAREYAIDLGIAMQLTNILRDIGEDLQRNRIYLPRDEMGRFGVTEDDLFAHRLNDRFRSLMNWQINRARFYYRRSELGIPMLSSDSRLPVYLARYNYSRILEKIEEIDYRVFEQRAFLNCTEKLSILPGILCRKRILAE